MIVYIDMVILLNFVIDVIALITTSRLLKIKVNYLRITAAGIVGELSLLTLFIDFNSIQLILFKIILSVLVIIVSFGVSSLIKRTLVFYQVCIILGGFLHLFRQNLNIDDPILVSIITLTLVVICVNVYSIIQKFLQNNLQLKKEVTIHFRNLQYIKLMSFLDTGNNLYDPHLKRPIILVKKKFIKNIKVSDSDILYVPYKTISDSNLLKCIKVNGVKVDNCFYKDVLVGIVSDDFSKEYDCILHPNLT